MMADKHSNGATSVDDENPRFVSENRGSSIHFSKQDGRVKLKETSVDVKIRL